MAAHDGRSEPPTRRAGGSSGFLCGSPSRRRFAWLCTGFPGPSPSPGRLFFSGGREPVALGFPKAAVLV